MPLTDRIARVRRPVGLSEGRQSAVADAWAVKNAETGCQCGGDDFLPRRRNGWWR